VGKVAGVAALIMTLNEPDSPEAYTVLGGGGTVAVTLMDTVGAAVPVAVVVGDEPSEMVAEGVPVALEDGVPVLEVVGGAVVVAVGVRESV